MKKRNMEEEKILESISPLLTTPEIETWQQQLHEMTPYAQLNLLLHFLIIQKQQVQLETYLMAEGKKSSAIPTLWNLEQWEFQSDYQHQETIIESTHQAFVQAYPIIQDIQQFCHEGSSNRLPGWIRCEFLSHLPKNEAEALVQQKKIVDTYLVARGRKEVLLAKKQWLVEEAPQLHHLIMPLLRPFHWEEDAGGSEQLNQQVSWWDLTRLNRKDLVSALIFGTRISLSVGLLAIGLALLIGIPVGAIAGYYGGKIDLLIYRLIEIWESMPTFFMLLMVVAFLQSKSIFLVILIIGLFGWTGFSRFIRGEYFRQKQLPYVEACSSMGYTNAHIIFSHILPNAIPPVLTLVPFAIMGAMTSEAGLSFLGLGEEGSSSWGVLMDEGRSAFPEESYLLWPPAIMLTVLLVAIALVGDALRDTLDPKLRR